MALAQLNPEDPSAPPQGPSRPPSDHGGWAAGPVASAPGPSAAPAAPTIGSQPWIDAWLQDWGARPGVNPSVANDRPYWNRRFSETGGINAGNQAFWEHLFMRPEGAPENWQSGGPGSPGYGTNVFNDPATKQWEGLVNGLVGKLNTPYTPPGYDQMITQLNNYFKQLQGPAYTPAQMDLIQTQSTDPLMAQRDAARQSIIQHFGARGMTPDSGVVQQALEQSDQRYGVANTQNQAQFATNAIGLDRQNQATAAQVGPQIAGLQQGLYNYNLGNQMQGVGYANQIPTTAWNRLTGAQSLINPLNPESLLYGQNAFQQQGYGQTNAWMQQLMQLLAQYFR